MLRKVWSSSYQSSVSFQILSDLHLEVNQQYSSYEIPACAEYLILAGDVGRLTDYNDYRNFLQKQTDRFRSVFLLLGNHEFFNETFDTGIEMAKQLEEDPAFDGRLIVLHQKRYDVPGSNVSILGCTLWSKVPQESVEVVQSKVKDFQRISDWSVDDHNARHDSDYSWLTKEIHSIHEENRTVAKDSKRRSILVVTHHAPSLQGTSNPKHAQSPWSVAFGTNILSEVPDGVKFWVFGHTHYNTDFKEKGVRVVSNQRGKHTTTMTSRGSNPVSRLAEAAKEKVAPSTSSKAKDPTENWTPEEMFETTLDKNGNPVPDAISYIDGPKMTQKRQGPDEGDVFDAANQDFD
ncbi:CorA-like Mg2+ transporter family protein [Aspergillus niger]|uniref:CorA-like Mg2+ transporter family protein n=2 Tax=Aspergillus niger TaxID=5061 RepID=A0A505I661_ASPNG|nr:CorA-like Mg2+ transporter family protein [Aspergillus niger]